MDEEWRSLPEEDLSTFKALLAIRDEVNQVLHLPSCLWRGFGSVT